MKNLIKVLICGMLTLVVANTLTAQTTRFNNRNNDERIAQVITTTDSTLTYVDSAVINSNEGGIIQVTVIGYAKDTNLVVTGVLQARYNKKDGTLTLATPTEAMAIVADAGLTTSTFTLVKVNDNIYVRVKGHAATNIRWYSLVKRKSISTVQ